MLPPLLLWYLLDRRARRHFLLATRSPELAALEPSGLLCSAPLAARVYAVLLTLVACWELTGAAVNAGWVAPKGPSTPRMCHGRCHGWQKAWCVIACRGA